MKKISHDSLFIELGTFKAGAVGRFAIVALTVIALTWITLKAFGYW